MEINDKRPVPKELKFSELVIGEVYCSGNSADKFWLCIADGSSRALVRLSDFTKWEGINFNSHKFVAVKSKLVVE